MYLKRDSLGRAEIVGGGDLEAASPPVPAVTQDVIEHVRKAVAANFQGARADVVTPAATYGAVRTFTAVASFPDGRQKTLYIAISPGKKVPSKTPGGGTVVVKESSIISLTPFKPSMFGSTTSGGISWGDIIEKAKQIVPLASKFTENPAMKVAFPYLTLGTAAAQAYLKQQEGGGGPPPPAPRPTAPAPAARPTPPAAARPAPPTPPTGPRPAAPPPAVAGYPDTIMGADPPMTDGDIMQLIRREPNRLKRARMIDNFQRARQRRDY